MARGFRAIWLGILDVYNELFPAVGMNLVWLLLNIPLTLVGTAVVIGYTSSGRAPDDPMQLVDLFSWYALAFLLVAGPNPAAAGIHHWANRLVHDERVEFALFWEGLRLYWVRALALFAISGIGLAMLIANALFYLTSQVGALQIFGILWLYAIVLWLSMAPFMLPLLVEQEDKRLRTVLRNSFFLMMANILPTLVLFVVLSVLIVLSIGVTLLIALLTAVAVAAIMARALQLLLERHRAATPATD